MRPQETISQAMSRAVNEAVALQPSRPDELIALVALVLRAQQQQPRMAHRDYYALHKDALATAIDSAMKEATAMREPWDDSSDVMELVADSLSRQAHEQRQRVRGTMRAVPRAPAA